MSSSADRLAEAVLKRRLQLGDSQVEIAQRGGPSNATLTNIENGRTENLEPATARKLDVGLKWESGSARAVWEGTGEARPLTPVGQLKRMISSVESAKMAADDKAYILRVLQAELENLEMVARQRARKRGAS